MTYLPMLMVCELENRTITVAAHMLHEANKLCEYQWFNRTVPLMEVPLILV